jgi:hypothetical protein
MGAIVLTNRLCSDFFPSLHAFDTTIALSISILGRLKLEAFYASYLERSGSG